MNRLQTGIVGTSQQERSHLSVEHVQTKQEIKQALQAIGAQPLKRFGQNFLIDGNLMRRLAASAELTGDDVVLEVGAGTGGLTDLLIAGAGQVIAVEIDRGFQDLLGRRFDQVEGFTLVRGDALESKHRLSAALIDAWSLAAPGGGETTKLVANLPYQIATPLVLNLLIDYPQVHRYCFTVQAEVGERFVASPGGKNFGPLAILSQTLCDTELIATLPPSVFWPEPAVKSVMLRMDTKRLNGMDQRQVRPFAALVRGVFDHRRKTLRSALGFVVAEDVRDKICAQVDATRRPESIGTEEWQQIFRLATDSV